jgi:tetratricopeptide (TPR) repeat protein
MKKDSNTSKFSQLLKWVGAFTAILSLGATIVSILKYGYGRMQTKHKVDALLSAEALQLQSHDYAAAWKTLEEAAPLTPGPKVREARVSLAMTWLEDVHANENQKFSDVTEKLEPVLTRALAVSPPGTQRADLRAHIGWAYFLASRDGRFDLDPAASYAAAIADDHNNPYAQAMWGHWILWQNCQKISDASGHFASALASSRQEDYVRQLQLAALLNCQNDEAAKETIQVANAMRREQRTIDTWSRDHILGLYYFLAHDWGTAEAIRFINAVPPTEHLATFHWLFDSLDPNDSNGKLRIYYLAVLQEAAGQRNDALTGYRSVLRQVPPHSGSLWQSADAAVKRLSLRR